MSYPLDDSKIQKVTEVYLDPRDLKDLVFSHQSVICGDLKEFMAFDTVEGLFYGKFYFRPVKHGNLESAKVLFYKDEASTIHPTHVLLKVFEPNIPMLFK